MKGMFSGSFKGYLLFEKHPVPLLGEPRFRVPLLTYFKWKVLNNGWSGFNISIRKISHWELTDFEKHSSPLLGELRFKVPL